MARIDVCDGCGKPADLISVGFIRDLEYCDPCSKLAAEYIAAVDSVHEEAAELFQSKKKALDESCPLKERPY